MIDTRIKVYNGLAVVTDIVGVWGSFIAALAYSSAVPFITGTDGLTYMNLRAFAALAVSLGSFSVLHIIFAVFYFSPWNPYGPRGILSLVPRIVARALTDWGIITVCCLVFQVALLPAAFYLSYGVILLFGTLALRAIVQAFLGWRYATKANVMNILIVGTNQRAYEFYKYIQSNLFLGYRIVGFLDDKNFCGQPDVNILAPLSEFESIARGNVIDVVVVFLTVRSDYDKIISIIELASIQGIPVQHMYDFFEHIRIKQSPSSIGQRAGVYLDSGPSNPVLISCKRLFDIIFSLIVLLMIAPILLLTAVAIKIDTPGPVFFIQQRVGRNKRRFGMIKFRTMAVNAEQLMPQLEKLNEMDGPVFKIKDDPRVTRVGYFLRRFNIDELPQFINVLMGDMSVVGPRPMAERDYDGFSEDWLRKRFSMRPGITCIWQIQPHRNEISFAQWMAMDMAYIDNWSFTSDLWIIIQTVFATAMGTGR